MKRIVCAAMVLAMCMGFANAEKTVLVGAALNLSNMSGSGDYESYTKDNGMRVGFGIGANYLVALNDKMGVLAGLAYETRGTSQSTSSTMYGVTVKSDMTTALSYLEIPILFSYKVMPELAVNVGPQLGMLLSAKTTGTVSVAGTSTDVDVDVKDGMSGMDLGLTLGVGYTIANMVVVGASYTLGLLNTDKDPPSGVDGSITNSNIQINAAYILKF